MTAPQSIVITVPRRTKAEAFASAAAKISAINANRRAS